MSELDDFARRIGNLTDKAALSRIVGKAGLAGKKAALDAAAHDLGGDRQFSGFRRKAPLGAGYDEAGTSVRINFRPAGLWKLAESGRKKSGRIYPRSGNRKGNGTVYRRAVKTPEGYRASSSYGPSRGLDTYSDAVKDAKREVPKAAAEQFRAEIRKVIR